ncbi:MAG TPA: hypothetical protein VMG10_26635, partial [Gemmataceae bacterium]|nr:hypothetical protein [Gemmataceae bacterium]
VCVTGTLDGQPFRTVLGIDSARPDAAYLPRTWARLEIDRLLAEDAVKNKNAIIALSKAMYVMTPYTSLLVLENEAMYAQYKVDRGRKDHWAMYPCPARIPVVYEPLSSNDPRWLVFFDPITGQPLNPLDDPRAAPEGLNQEGNQLGFFPPAQALAVKASSTIQIRPSNLIINPDSQAPAGLNQENNQLGFFPPAQALAVKASSTIHTRPSILVSDLPPYRIELEVPSISRVASYAESDAQLKERIRRENRGHKNLERIIEGAEWDRVLMPDPEKIRQQALQREIDHARHRPPPTDIWSARSLNALLRHLIAQQKQSVRGPNVPLSDDILYHINLTFGESGGNFALLKDNGCLQWPKPLQQGAFKEARARLNTLMQFAFNNVSAGSTLDSSTLSDLRVHYRKLKDTLDANVGRMSPEEYIEAARYLRDVKNTITALKHPNVIAQLNGNWKTKVRDVAQLVRFMGEKNLRFAPAAPKDQASYVALYQALAAFDAALPRPTAPGKRRTGYATLDGYDTFAADNINPQWAKERLAALLADPEQAKRSSLWRYAARLADQRKQYDSALRYLRQALDLERNQRHDLLSLRRDFTWFLSLSEQRVCELIAQNRSVPRELLDWVMAIADQWRAVDGMDVEPCDRAGNILRLAGERELAWSYVTSPAALQRGTAADWLALALRQHARNDYELAERAFAVAASLEPGNAEIVWERALNHRAAGCRDAAHTLLRQLDNSSWAERYREFQLRARCALEEER